MFYFISDISFQADNRAIQCRCSNDSIVLAVMGTYGQFSHSTGESATHLPVRYKAANNQEVDPPTFPVCYKAAKNQEVDLLSGCSYYRKPG